MKLFGKQKAVKRGSVRQRTTLLAALLSLSVLAASAQSECTGEGGAGTTASGVYDKGFSCMDSKLSRILDLLGENRAQPQAPQRDDPAENAPEPLRDFAFDGIRVSLDLAAYSVNRKRRHGTIGGWIITEITITNENPQERLALIVQSKQREYTNLRLAGEARPRRGIIKTFHQCVDRCADIPEQNWTTLLPGVPYTVTFAEELTELPRAETLNLALRLLVKKRGKRAVSTRDFPFNQIRLRPVQEAPALPPPVRSMTFDGIKVSLERASMSKTRRGAQIFLDIAIANENREPVVAFFAADGQGMLRVRGEGKARKVRSSFSQCGAVKDTLRGCGRRAEEDWALLLPNLPQTFRISTTSHQEHPATGTVHLSFRMVYKKEGDSIPRIKDIAFSRAPLEGWTPEGP